MPRLPNLVPFAVVVGLASATMRAQGVPPLETLLQRVGSYVEQYERSFSAVVSDEHYVQRLRRGRDVDTRQLRSEVALVAAGGGLEWLFFRDAYEVDGRKLPKQKERLATLFNAADPDATALAKRIADESARYNLGKVQRTINTPTVALMFLRPGDQARSRFTVVGEAHVDGVPAVQLQFLETAMPRLVLTRDHVPAEGTIWIAPAAGEVLRTQLYLGSAGAEAVIAVDYVKDEKLDLLVPVRMTEAYSVGRWGPANRGDDAFDRLRGSQSKQLIEGRATYSNFRRFTVQSKTTIR